MTNLDHILKSRDITLSTKVHLVKFMVFPVVMYGCESWTIKKAEHQRIYAFELRCLESPLDCKEIQPVHPKGNQSWIFIGSIDADATLILWPPELKNCKRPWCWERLQAVREAGDRGWDGWMASLTQWTWVWVGSRNWWWTGRLGIVQLVHGITKIQTQLSDWTELNLIWLGSFVTFWDSILGFPTS